MKHFKKRAAALLLCFVLAAFSQNVLLVSASEVAQSAQENVSFTETEDLGEKATVVDSEMDEEVDQKDETANIVDNGTENIPKDVQVDKSEVDFSDKSEVVSDADSQETPDISGDSDGNNRQPDSDDIENQDGGVENPVKDGIGGTTDGQPEENADDADLSTDDEKLEEQPAVAGMVSGNATRTLSANAVMNVAKDETDPETEEEVLKGQDITIKVGEQINLSNTGSDGYEHYGTTVFEKISDGGYSSSQNTKWYYGDELYDPDNENNILLLAQRNKGMNFNAKYCGGLICGMHTGTADITRVIIYSRYPTNELPSDSKRIGSEDNITYYYSISDTSYNYYCKDDEGNVYYFDQYTYTNKTVPVYKISTSWNLTVVENPDKAVEVSLSHYFPKYTAQHDELVTNIESPVEENLTLQAGNSFTVEKPVTSDMRDENGIDAAVPYFYEKSVNGGIIATWKCTSVYYSDGDSSKKWDITDQTDWTQLSCEIGEYQYTIYSFRDYEITREAQRIRYTWERFYDETQVYQVTYSFNFGSGEGQLPTGLYGVGDASLLSDRTYASADFNYNIKNRIQQNGIGTETFSINEDMLVDPVRLVGTAISNQGCSYTDYIGYDGNNTYYLLEGWMCDNSACQLCQNGMIHEQGAAGSAGVAGTVVTYTAQWKAITKAELEALAKELAYDVDLTDKYSGFTDARISEKSSSSGWSYRYNSKDKPLLLNEDREVSYKATMQMNSMTALLLQEGGRITDESFAHFDITVQLDENVTLLADENGNVEFSFTCTFLEPDGVIYAGNAEYADEDKIEGDYYQGVSGSIGDVQGRRFVFKVPLEDLKGINIFTIPVHWISTNKNQGGKGYQASELQKEIVLEVAAAKINDGYEDAVKATGIITGRIDLDKSSANTQRHKYIIAGVMLTGDAMYNKFTNNGTRKLDILDTLLAGIYLDTAMQNITLTANEVYAKVSTKVPEKPSPSDPEPSEEREDDSSGDYDPTPQEESNPEPVTVVQETTVTTPVTPEVPVEISVPSDAQTAAGAATGDNSLTMSWLVLAMLAITIVAVLGIRRKRRS